MLPQTESKGNPGIERTSLMRLRRLLAVLAEGAGRREAVPLDRRGTLSGQLGRQAAAEHIGRAKPVRAQRSLQGRCDAVGADPGRGQTARCRLAETYGRVR